MKTIESGYEITIKVFVPADPRHPQTIETAMAVILSLSDDRILDLGQAGETRVEIGEPRWIARRKSPAPPPDPTTTESASPEADAGHGPGCNGPGDTPATAPSESVADGAQLPESVALPGMPAFLDRTKRA